MTSPDKQAVSGIAGIPSAAQGVPRDHAEFVTIEAIAERAVKLEREHNGKPRRGAKLHHQMNVSACHASGNPLRLNDLLEADDFNFAHDVFGIDRHINRDTGQMLNCFRPRFSGTRSVNADTNIATDMAGPPQIAPAEELQADEPQPVSTRLGFILAAFVDGVIAHHIWWSAGL